MMSHSVLHLSACKAATKPQSILHPKGPKPSEKGDELSSSAGRSHPGVFRSASSTRFGVPHRHHESRGERGSSVALSSSLVLEGCYLFPHLFCLSCSVFFPFSFSLFKWLFNWVSIFVHLYRVSFSVFWYFSQSYKNLI